MGNEVEDLKFFQKLNTIIRSIYKGNRKLAAYYAGKNLEKDITNRIPSDTTKAKIRLLKVEKLFSYALNLPSFVISDDEMSFKRNLLTLGAIIEDQITRLVISQGSEEYLEYRNLLKARENNEDFDLELKDRIIGNNKKYPYRSADDVGRFFDNLGILFRHNVIPKRYCVHEQLKMLDIKEIHRIIQKGLLREKYFEEYAKENGLDSEDFYKGAKEDFQKWIEKSSSPEEYVDINFLLNLNIELLHNKMPQTPDEELNELISDAKDFIQKSDIKNKQIALEKIWHAFERMKTYGGEKKKPYTEKIISKISAEFGEQLFLQEFNKLRDIGNNEYRIRHHETDKKKIKDEDTADYFFIRMYNLIAFCLSKIVDSSSS